MLFMVVENYLHLDPMVLVTTIPRPNLPYLPIVTFLCLDSSTQQDTSALIEITRSYFFDNLGSEAEYDKRINHFKDYLSGNSFVC